MAIAREDLERLGFKQVPPLVNWLKEMWYFDKGCYTVRVGYLQGKKEFPHTAFLDGDKCSLVDVINWMMADVANALDELEMGEDW